jgi:hypothetical protein
MAEKIEFDLTVKNNQLDKALESSTKKAVSLEGVLETALGVLGGGLAIKAFDSLVGGFESLISIGKEAIDAAAAQEVATNNLNNALARQGNFTKQASKDLLDFASGLQQTTVFEDDAVIASTALLQSLTKLNAEGLKQGVNAAADFATVLGVDLETATRLVAKAAEGNTEAFKRYGVEIKKGSSDTESFANTIEALNKQFGGASAAQLNTYSGSLKALNNAYGDLLEPIGDIIVKNPLVVALFNELRGGINGANEEISSLVPQLQSLVNDGLIAASVAAQVLLDALDGLTVVGKGLVNTFQIIGGGIAQSIVEPIKLLIDGLLFLGERIPGIGDEFKGLTNPLQEASDALNSFTVDGIEGFKKAADTNVFRSFSEGTDQLTAKLIDSSAQIAIAQKESIKNNKDVVSSTNEKNADILKAEQQLAADILTLQAQSAAEQASLDAQLASLSIENETISNQAKIEAIFAQKVAEAQAVYEGELLKNQASLTGQQLQLANDKAFEALKLAALKAATQKEIDEKKRLKDEEARLNKERIANQGDTLATIATLASSNNKTLAAVGKAAALTQIAIDGPQAVTKALAAFPPPFNLAAATAVGAAVAAQAAKVVGIGFAGGGVVGGEFGGASGGSDNVAITARKDEMFLNGQQQKNLFDMINNGGMGGGNIQIFLDGRELAIGIRNQIESGFKLI